MLMLVMYLMLLKYASMLVLTYSGMFLGGFLFVLWKGLYGGSSLSWSFHELWILSFIKCV
jgi:hypothetical protein